MDWRRLLLSMVSRFFAILRKENAERTDAPRCYILDDTTLEKTGRHMEKASRVFDHVNGHCVLGFKLLLLALSDGASTLPVDFSLHREKGKKNDFGLTREERKKQFRFKRQDSTPDHIRAKECDKIDVAVEMLHRAWKHEMFRAEKEQLLALTLGNRLLSCMEKLLTALTESLGAEPMQMIQGLLNDEECARQTMVLAEALLKYYSDNEREGA